MKGGTGVKKPFRFLKWTGKKAVVLLVAVILLSAAVVDVTMAILAKRTEALQNTFEPAKVILSLADENLQASPTGHRVILNKGEVPLFIRVFAVVSWESTSEEFTILAQMPNVSSNLDKEENYDENADVFLTFYNTFSTEKWFQGEDGFFYCTVPLKPGETLHMLESAKVNKKMEGYAVRVEMLAEGIQALPAYDENNQLIHPAEVAWPAVEVIEVKVKEENGDVEEITEFHLQKRSVDTP